MSTENALLTILTEKISNDTVTLPTLPEVAVKIRRAADDPDINLGSMADVIAQDPALSARIMKVANSALMGRSVKVETLNQAVTRIGLRQIKNIATAMAMEQLFVSRNALIKSYLSKAWEKTVDISSVSIVLMQGYLKKNRHASLNVDTITLAALIHNIGVLPILTEAERHEDVFANPTFLGHAIKKLAGRIGSTIMKTWDFPADFVEVTEKWSDFSYQTEKAAYVDFIRIGAMHCGVLKNIENKDALLQGFVDKGILPDRDYLQSNEFIERQAAVKAAFS
ncbi:MAG: HD-like signal output (HDOD) protein [Alteromonadaceae bacterium]|jgi:HD-like signal output (HDOD) protein